MSLRLSGGTQATGKVTWLLAMNTTLIFVAIVVFSFTLGNLITRHASRYVVLSGAEYLVLGLLLGPHVGLGVVGQTQLGMLEPVMSLLLGLAGFLVGIRAKTVLVDRERTALGFGGALATVLLFAAAFLPILDRTLARGLPDSGFEIQHRLFAIGDYGFELSFMSETLWLSLVLGAAACVTTARWVDSFKQQFGARGPVTTLIECSTHASQIVALLVLGFVLATVRATNEVNPWGLSVAEWAMAAVGGSVICGLLFSLFIGNEQGTSKVFLASVGLVTFAAGAGSALGISPLFVNLIAGLTVAFTSPHARRLHQELDRLQHPVLVLLMIFAGAHWVRPENDWLWALPVLYVALRYVVRRATTGALALASGDASLRVPRLGDGLMGQGSLAIAIGIEVSSRFPAQASLVLTTVLFGTLLSDLWSRGALRSLLADAGELDVRPAGETTSEEPEERKA